MNPLVDYETDPPIPFSAPITITYTSPVKDYSLKKKKNQQTKKKNG